MGKKREHNFWISNNKYQELAKEFEMNITRKSPETVSSRRMCSCIGEYAHECGWAASSVVYYKQNGPTSKL